MEQDALLLSSHDPRAVAALRHLASPLGVELVAVGQGLVEARGDVGALLLAAASGLTVEAATALAEHADWDDVVAGVPTSADAGARRPRHSERQIPLVQLARRAELVDRLDREIAHQRPGTTTGVVYCDVAAGVGTGGPSATVLGTAAARLRAALRRSDTLAHLGGGCFITVLTDLPIDRAEEVASRSASAVRACFDEPLATAGGIVLVAPLVGVLVHPGPLNAARLADAGTDTAPSGADLVRAVERSLAR